jgi:hypothetical protein
VHVEGCILAVMHAYIENRFFWLQIGDSRREKRAMYQRLVAGATGWRCHAMPM